MKFTPRILSENVNISRTSPLREFFILLGGILGVLVAVYLLLGFAWDSMVDRIPDRIDLTFERYFGKAAAGKGCSFPRAEPAVQSLLDDLAALQWADRRFTVRLVSDKEVNAVALPGDTILVYTGLLEKIDSENELAMVLAHELGHFFRRDHLRGLGRGAVLVILSAAVLGGDSSGTDLLQRVLLTTDLKYSRKQEEYADKFALALLNKKYGHVSGATAFFEKASRKERAGICSRFFMTHPLSRYRVEALRRLIEEQGLPAGKLKPLSPEMVTEIKGVDQGAISRDEGMYRSHGVL